jgi:hypothetical protein
MACSVNAQIEKPPRLVVTQAFVAQISNLLAQTIKRRTDHL